MKKMLIVSLLVALFCATSLQTTAQTPAPAPVPTNRYAMKLKQNADGSYALTDHARLAKIIDLSRVPDLLVPYVHRNERLSSKDYRGVEVREVVYKTHDGYELSMAIDMAVSDGPAPVVVYLHGGGWARGSKDSARSLSQYLAKQKGITGVRIAYTLAPQPGADVRVSIADVKAAVQYLRDHAQELHIDPTRLGFYGSSAGAHLAAVGAMSEPDAKAFVGNSGIYDLETAAICQRTKDAQRIAYFCNLDPKILRAASPASIVPKKNAPAALLFCGTGDITVEYSQSEAFAAALKRRGARVDLQIYPYYSHNLNNKASDKMEEIFFKTVDFFVANLRGE